MRALMSGVRFMLRYAFVFRGGKHRRAISLVFVSSSVSIGIRDRPSRFNTNGEVRNMAAARASAGIITDDGQ